MEAFYILGGTLAGWALLVSFIGVVRKDFPSTPTAERIVGAISVVLVLAAISAAIVGALNEEHEEGDEGGHQEAALVLPA